MYVDHAAHAGEATIASHFSQRQPRCWTIIYANARVAQLCFQLHIVYLDKAVMSMTCLVISSLHYLTEHVNDFLLKL